MPKMPEGEKKEESAESLAEKKEQVTFDRNEMIFQLSSPLVVTTI